MFSSKFLWLKNLFFSFLLTTFIESFFLKLKSIVLISENLSKTSSMLTKHCFGSLKVSYGQYSHLDIFVL